MVPFSFAGHEMRLVGGRALYWPREGALIVADLHLEKASHFARHGQMLPPYDSRETLERLALAIRQTGARRVIALGDSFHDRDGPARLEPHAAGMLAALTRATEWLWIAGNHDGAVRLAEGDHAEEIALAGIALRHEARAGEAGAEISGHFHPKLTLTARGRRIARPCAVIGVLDGEAGRMILPAFGAFTGGLDAGAAAIVAAMRPARSLDAALVAGGRLRRYPLWREAA